MIGIIWLDKRALLLLHDRTLMRHGGSRGIRDEGLLESALARPQNLLAYQENVSLSLLAASYAFGIAKNHPFVDGNKRAAFAAVGTFLKINGWNLTATKVDAALTILKLAASGLSEEELAAWIGSNLARRPSP
jgi:death-on-curing protein